MAQTLIKKHGGSLASSSPKEYSLEHGMVILTILNHKNLYV